MSRYDAPCTHYIGAEDRVCGQTPTRRYLPGTRCRQHTPAALKGQPESKPNPDRTLDAIKAKAAQEREARIAQ